MPLTFLEKLDQTISRNDSLLCVGLDPEPAKLPAHLHDEENPILAFTRAIVDATADLVGAYKPNFAFFGALGEPGWSTLKATLEHIPSSIPVIVDAKVGDIGNTAEQYARMFFDELGADALTVNPYMGEDAVAPFLQRRDRGIFLLCLTSNKGADDFEKLSVADTPLYEHVARKARGWRDDGSLGLVVGATQPEAIGRIRALAPELPFLIPGVGAQGGDLQAAVEQAQDARGRGLVINASRSVLYASDGLDFADAARRAAGELRDEINQFRAGR